MSCLSAVNMGVVHLFVFSQRESMFLKVYEFKTWLCVETSTCVYMRACLCTQTHTQRSLRRDLGGAPPCTHHHPPPPPQVTSVSLEAVGGRDPRGRALPAALR